MIQEGMGLSRRQMLAGIGALGATGTGAVFGTGLPFGAVKSFAGNETEDEGADLYVGVDYSGPRGGPDSHDVETVVQGDTAGTEGQGESIPIEIENATPGDSGAGEFRLSPVGDPVYVWMTGALTAADENGHAEPELAAGETGDANDPGASDGEGALADAVQVTLEYCDADGRLGGHEIATGSLSAVFEQLTGGIPLDGDPGSEGRAPFASADGPYDGDEEPGVDGPCVRLRWDLPADVGNEVQTDSVEFDVEFHAEQARRTDGTNDPRGT